MASDSAHSYSVGSDSHAEYYPRKESGSSTADAEYRPVVTGTLTPIVLTPAVASAESGRSSSPNSAPAALPAVAGAAEGGRTAADRPSADSTRSVEVTKEASPPALVHAPPGEPAASDETLTVSSANSLETEAENRADVRAEGEESTPDPGTLLLAPAMGNLIGGILPVDVPALERGVEEFFARIDGLGDDWTSFQAASRLAPWLVTAAFATAAYEFVREQLKPRQLDEPRPGWRNVRRTWFPSLGLSPGEDAE